MASAQVPDAERSRLSKAAVVDRGLALADAEGLDALTLRRLATELGVTPMAFYWHFRSKEQLLEGLAERVWDEIDTEVDPAADWPDQLRSLLESLVGVLRAHPAAPQLVMLGEKLNAEPALRATEVALQVVERGGFGPAETSAVCKGTLWTALMLVMSEPGYHPAMAEEERAEWQRRSQIRLAMLPPDRYPRLAAAAGPMTSCTPADRELHYRFGIDLFIAGVRAMAARPH